jgi:ribonuclease G
MAEEILINVTTREVRIAILEDGILQAIEIERNKQQGIVGNMYKGKVNRLLPGIQAAFIDIGLRRAAFLHVKDMVTGPLNIDISDLLQEGQTLLVQVYKDPLGSKGARLTTQFAVPSRYLVLTPNTPQVLVSQKIGDEEERLRLQNMISSDEKDGYIFRTAAIGAAQSTIDMDKRFLQKIWAEITTRAKEASSGDVIFTEIPLVLRLLRDVDRHAVQRIRVDDQTVTQTMKAFAAQAVPELADRIEYYEEKRPIFDIYHVEDELQKTLQRKINLKSGGHLIFDQTEAMTTIDVNTGSYLGKRNDAFNHEETIYKTNKEAVDVIARQVRLRNLGGIIIIDFIDMSDAANQAHLLELLNKALAKDTARIEISELSSLGLVQMTRKRTRESLEHILCVSCPLCHRRGFIKSLQTVCYDIFRDIKQTAFHFPSWPGFVVLASEQIIHYLLAEEIAMLNEIKVQLGKPLQLRANASFVQEQYNILPLERA